MAEEESLISIEPAPFSVTCVKVPAAPMTSIVGARV
jgi:hypothetical protein